MKTATSHRDATHVDREEVTTHERVVWMRRNSRTAVGALAVAAAAALLATFSFSLYSSSSANPGNAVTTGIMTQDNSKDGAAILTADKLVPGDHATGDVTITNVGDVRGDFSLQAANLVDNPGTPGHDLSRVLKLTITEPATHTTVYDGTLAAFTKAALGTWSDGDSHTYTFSVEFPSSSGDEYQGAGASVDFAWTATQS